MAAHEFHAEGSTLTAFPSSSETLNPSHQPAETGATGATGATDRQPQNQGHLITTNQSVGQTVAKRTPSLQYFKVLLPFTIPGFPNLPGLVLCSEPVTGEFRK